MSKNFNALYDEDNDTPDWVEIYNKADTSINVENYSLSDDVNEMEKMLNDYLQFASSGITEKTKRFDLTKLIKKTPLSKGRFYLNY